MSLAQRSRQTSQTQAVALTSAIRIPAAAVSGSLGHYAEGAYRNYDDDCTVGVANQLPPIKNARETRGYGALPCNGLTSSIAGVMSHLPFSLRENPALNGFASAAWMVLVIRADSRGITVVTMDVLYWLNLRLQLLVGLTGANP